MNRLAAVPAFAASLPVTDPVLIVALALGVFLIAPLVFERLKVPGMIGLIVSGALIGPNGFGLLARDPTIVLLGTVGLLYLMFMAGAEIDLHGFQRYRNRSLIFGGLTFILPQTLGTGVGLLLGYGIAASLLLASMFASHTLVSYPIASRLGISKNEAVTTGVGGTIITDSAALLVLAVIASSVQGELNAGFWVRLAVLLSAYVALVMLGLPRLGRWFFRNPAVGPTAEYVFVLAALFACAFLAVLAGVEAIIGAFLAGLALNRLIPENSPLSNRLQFFGNAFFIPFFLLSVGMLVDVRVFLGELQAWYVMIAMSVTVCVTKWLAARLSAATFDYSKAEGWVLFGLSVPQAAATLAATLIGFEIGLFDDAVLNGSILMILVTCIVGPWVVEKYGREVALQEAQKPYEPREAPQRILIPIANPATADALLDLAFLIRTPASDQPLYPLIVVPQREDEASAAQVAEAEKMLQHAVVYAAGAEVPVVPLTRVDYNFASGIVRGMAETRTSIVVVGWDGRRSTRRRVFGTVLDQVLERTRQMIVVAKLGHPLNTTSRLVLVLPPGTDHAPGFFEAARMVKFMAHRLGASISGMVVGGNPQIYAQHFSLIRPDAPTGFATVAGWNTLIDDLRARLRPDDLVVVCSARRGTLSWHPNLERLPGALAQLVPESFIMLYPSEAEAPEDARVPGATLRRLLSPERILVDLPPMPFPAAVERLLSTGFSHDPAYLRRVTDELMRSVESGLIEIVPGVVFPHARLDDLAEPMLFVATSRSGIVAPDGAGAVHLIFLLLSPTGSVQEHLQSLSEVARLVGNPDRLQELIRHGTGDDVYEWFRTAAA